MNETTDNYKDEIELMDILLYLWKWKYFFLAGIFLFAVLFTMFSIYTESHKPKTYEIKFALKVGMVLDKYGNEEVYIKSPDNIVKKINSGAFNEDIKEILQKNYPKSDYNQLTFKIMENSTHRYLIPVLHNTTDVDQGIATIKALVNAINNTYFDLILNLKNQFEKEKENLSTEKEDQAVRKEGLDNEIDFMKEKIQANRDYLKKVKIRINEMMYELNTIDKPNKIGNREDISDEALPRNIYYEKKKLKAMYKDKLIEYTAKINEVSCAIRGSKENIKGLKRKLKALKKQLNIFQERELRINNLQEHYADLQVVKIFKDPVVKETLQGSKNVSMFFLGAIAGFFIILFLTFLLEYFQRYKTRKGKK
jgi:hypothetical protein